MKELNPEAFKEMIEKEDFAVVDFHSCLAFGSQHIPGSLSMVRLAALPNQKPDNYKNCNSS
jgi:hypothetical protein